jgi:hypothetical protein
MYRIIAAVMLIATAPIIQSVQQPPSRQDIRHQREREMRQIQLEDELRRTQMEYQRNLRSHRENCSQQEQRIRIRYEQEANHIQAYYRASSIRCDTC